MNQKSRSPLFVIFTTVFIDLVGFGMVIPLVGIYGVHFGATAFQLGLLGGIYSIMQFFFAPFWGHLSDRHGRRPILLLSLCGSTASYLLFGLAPSFAWLLISRAVGGIFAANISTAQAYIADITKPEDRAKGMGLIGAAFGIGFTLGPPIGGIAAAKLGLAAPGLIAAAICGLNVLLAWFRLHETLPLSARQAARAASAVQSPSSRWQKFMVARKNPELFFWLITFFFVTFAFSNLEQTFSLLFEKRFTLTTGDAGYKTGMVLMFVGVLGAFIQGGLIRKLAPKFGERRLIVMGLLLYTTAMAVLPYGPSYASYFALVIPLAFGSGFINPCLSSLISREASAQQLGQTLGVSQAMGSLARAMGPFLGLVLFEWKIQAPYFLGAAICALLFVACLRRLQKWAHCSENQSALQHSPP